MKITHVISGLDPRYGGTVAALTGLVQALTQKGVENQIVATQKANERLDIAKKLQSIGVDVRLISSTWTPLRWHWKTPGVLGNALKQSDLVHIHGIWEDIHHQAIGMAHCYDLPVLWSPHGMLDPWSLNHHKWRKKIYYTLRLRQDLKRADALALMSQDEAKLVSQLKLPLSLFSIPLGIWTKEFECLPPRGSWRSRLGIGDAPIAVFLGRLHPIKGLDVLLDAMANCRTTNSHLWLVGPDEAGYLHQIKKWIDQKKLAHRVHCLGPQYGRDRLVALSEADFFVLPSRHENFGISVVEAMACGLPVLISDQVQIADELRDQEVGSVLPLNSAAWAAELDRWFQDTHLCRQTGQRAIQLAKQRYDWPVVIDRWIDCYRQLIDHRDRR